MNIQGWAEIALTLGLAVVLGWPIGIYMSRVWNGERTWLDPVLKPVEGVFYRASGVDPNRSQDWFGYAGRCQPSTSSAFSCFNRRVSEPYAPSGAPK